MAPFIVPSKCFHPSMFFPVLSRLKASLSRKESRKEQRVNDACERSPPRAS